MNKNEGMIDENDWIDRRKCEPFAREQIFVKHHDGSTEFTFISENYSGRISQGFTHWKPLTWIDL